jgi:hypothetical protein
MEAEMKTSAWPDVQIINRRKRPYIPFCLESNHARFSHLLQEIEHVYRISTMDPMHGNLDCPVQCDRMKCAISLDAWS